MPLFLFRSTGGMLAAILNGSRSSDRLQFKAKPQCKQANFEADDRNETRAKY